MPYYFLVAQRLQSAGTHLQAASRYLYLRHQMRNKNFCRVTLYCSRLESG
jgi:hypothetical protein